MYFIYVIKSLRTLAVVVPVSVLVIACSTGMTRVQKTIESGDLVSQQALETVDVLNEYSHELRRPEQDLLGIDIAFERQNVLAGGDNIYAQVALATRRPILRPTNMHLLVFNSAASSDAEIKKMQAAAGAGEQLRNALPPGSTLSLDWLNPPKLVAGATPALVKSNHDLELVAYLRQFARLRLTDKNQHYVLITGDLSTLSDEQKQNVLDLVSILRAKGSTLSTLTVSDKPEFAFLDSMAKRGNGLASTIMKTFDPAAWIRQEILTVSAGRINDIKLYLEAGDGVVIREISSPKNVYTASNVFEHEIPELMMGKDYILLAKLKLSSRGAVSRNDILRVRVEYLDKAGQQFYTAQKSAGVNFVSDRNKILSGLDARVQRSLLILDTHQVLQEIIPVLREKRYYKAIAMLTRQSNRLTEFGAAKADSELVRDAELLDRYSDRLYEFDEEFFQTAKIWHDLSWDTARFADTFDQ